MNKRRRRQVRTGSRKQRGARPSRTRALICKASPTPAAVAHPQQTAPHRGLSRSRQQPQQGFEKTLHAQSLSHSHTRLNRACTGPPRLSTLLLNRLLDFPRSCGRAGSPQRLSRASGAAASALHLMLHHASHACPMRPTGSPQLPSQPRSGSADPHCNTARAALHTPGPLRCMRCCPSPLLRSIISRCGIVHK